MAVGRELKNGWHTPIIKSERVALTMIKMYFTDRTKIRNGSSDTSGT